MSMQTELNEVGHTQHVEHVSGQETKDRYAAVLPLGSFKNELMLVSLYNDELPATIPMCKCLREEESVTRAAARTYRRYLCADLKGLPEEIDKIETRLRYIKEIVTKEGDSLTIYLYPMPTVVKREVGFSGDGDATPAFIECFWEGLTVTRTSKIEMVARLFKDHPEIFGIDEKLVAILQDEEVQQAIKDANAMYTKDITTGNPSSVFIQQMCMESQFNVTSVVLGSWTSDVKMMIVGDEEIVSPSGHIWAATSQMAVEMIATHAKDD